ncbi:hypothetical protein QJS10_CPA06g01843 [Acorus calamus]|uniref:rRNA-processing protein EFG1 n=1 Tax=Acorus calamus TaxID=4465 RepID=A0AAV9EPY5_ACOCL|nr:hypothetical protein QJS10_CPA06g01843 [Acorus calamus]
MTAQEKKLEELKKKQELHTRLAVERKIFLRDKRIKFFERRKIERSIRRLEKLQRTTSDNISETSTAEQLSKLKEDLEYVRGKVGNPFLYVMDEFFPKKEKYVSIFLGGDDAEEKRNRLRKLIKANIKAAAASGKDLEETGSDDDCPPDMSDDDFFLNGSSSDEANADDEWTDKSTREQTSSTSGKTASGMSSDEKNQRQVSARALMPPPRALNNSFRNFNRAQPRFSSSSMELSTSSNTSQSRNGSFSRNFGSSRTDHGSNLSSNSDAHKPRRKRRPKKKKQA